MRKTKIVCTIGPTTRDPEMISRLIDAGMNVARINMSHDTQERHAEVMAMIRCISDEKKMPVAILVDLAGPKIRLGELAGPMELHRGDKVRLTIEDVVGEGDLLPVRYDKLVEEVAIGSRVSMADGLLRLNVLEKSGNEVLCEVQVGGTLTSRKGVNLAHGGDSLPALTKKDIKDLRFALEQQVDWVALSFVRSGRDVEGPRTIMEEVGYSVPVLAKIEKPQALKNLDEILKAFDGLMVARGDLGVEMQLEDMPAIQKDLITRANNASKPVITATQMLLSMVNNPRPTRAEVTDVANAILDGTDAVMLSEETAQGNFPIESVEVMHAIARKTEDRLPRDRRRYEVNDAIPVPEALSRAARDVAQLIDSPLIVTPTTSGATARLLASTRPGVPILALSSCEQTVRQLCLNWGVRPMIGPHVNSAEEVFDMARKGALDSGLAKRGERVVILTGFPLNKPGSTSLLEVLDI